MAKSIDISLIIYNARIYHPDHGRLNETALAVFRNTILAPGSDADILSLKNEATELIDAGGRWLFPAFTDFHTHFMGYVKRQQEVELSHCRSLAEALDAIRKKVAETPMGSWITGGGWNRNIWGEEEYPNRHQLDDISTGHFIALDSKDWHTMWVNTPVLELAGIPVDHPYPNAKHLALDHRTGEFTGVLEESTRLAIFDLIPPLSYSGVRKAYLDVRQEFYRLGFAGIHSMETPVEFRAYQDAQREDELGLRVSWYLPVKNLNAAAELALSGGVGSDFLKICGVKIFVDGAFGSQTAELLDDYLELGHSGVEVLKESELDQMVGGAVDAGLSCAVHAIGDRAIRKTLHVFGQHAEQSRKLKLHHRIEHAQLIHPDDIKLFKKYNIIASVQPVHLASDIPVMNKYLGERGKYAYPYATLLKNGVVLAFGSDTPVETFNPWAAIYTAMERRFNLQPDQPSFYPSERLSLQDSLRAYTMNGHKATGMSRRLGAPEPGMLADFFIADRDIFALPATEIRETGSVCTVVDGRIVYRTI